MIGLCKRKLLLSLAVMVLSGFPIFCARSLSCAPPPLSAASIANAAAIFQGSVQSKRALNEQELQAARRDGLKSLGDPQRSLRLYSFLVARAWKGVQQGQKVDVLFNTYWGDDFLEGESYVVFGSERIGGMIWSPLCGYTSSLASAERTGTLAQLEKLMQKGAR